MPDPQSRHEVKQWVRAMIEARHFKDCEHLSIDETEWSIGYATDVTYFLPRCNQSSFDWDCPAIDENTKEQMLIQGMAQGGGIVSCPNNCTCFESRVEAEQARLEAKKAAEAKAKRERLLALVVRPIKYIFDWFGKLSWQVQIVMILAAVFVIRPKLALELVQAIKTLAGLLGKGG